MAHAENAFHLALRGKTRLQALNHAHKRLIDNGGRPSRLADHCIAGRKIGHVASLLVVARAQCPTPWRLASDPNRVQKGYKREQEEGFLGGDGEDAMMS